MQCQKIKTYMETGRVVFLPVDAIRPNPAQPRRVFQEEALEELSASIRRHGVLQPLSVRRGEGGFQLVCGERRLRAARLAGLTEVPCSRSFSSGMPRASRRLAVISPPRV